MQEENYFEKEGLSNSALSTFNYSPELYYKAYVTQEISGKKKTEGFEYGTLIHLLMFEPKKFEQNYMVHSGEIVGGKMGLFLEALSKYDVMDDAAYEEAMEKSDFKLKLDTIKKSIYEPKEPNNNLSYLSFLKNSRGKLVITDQQHIDATIIAEDACKKIEEYAADYLSKLEHFTSLQDYDVFEELEIYWEYEGRKYKSKLDKLYLHKSGSHFLYIDAKTDSKNPSFEYSKTFEYWKTYRQIAFYDWAVRKFIEQNYECDSMATYGYYGICAISSVNNDIMIHNVSYKYILKGVAEVNKDLELLTWHEETNQWKYPKEVYDKLGEEGNLVLTPIE